MVSHSIATISPQPGRLPQPLQFYFFYGGGGKITVEHDTSSSQPERENQEIKGLNTGVLLERPQIIVCDPKLRKEAEALQSDSELRQTIKQRLEGKKGA